MIIGAGKVTHYLCKLLTKTRYKIKVIEKDKEKALKFATEFPKISVILGDSADQELLLNEGLERCDAFISLTNIDEENIVSALFAKNKNIKKVIAKTTRYDAAKLLSNNQGIDTVCPKHIASTIVSTFIESKKEIEGNKILTQYNLLEGRINATEFLINDEFELLNTSLKDLKIKKGIIIAAIIRNNEVIIPNGNDQILNNDRVVIISQSHMVNDINKIV